MQEIILSIIMGLGLSAACGFRVFVPLLVVSMAAHSGHLTLGESWLWLGSDAALILFGTATVIEICGYYLPVVDHFLDVISAPAATVAGSIVAAAFFVDMSPLLKWTLAIIAGGGSASVIHLTKSAARALVSGSTLGTGNWLVSTGEMAVSGVMSAASVFLPFLALFILICLLGIGTWVYKKVPWRFFRRKCRCLPCEKRPEIAEFCSQNNQKS